MALNLARSKQWSDVTTESFSRLARKIGAEQQTVLQEVARSVALIRGAWSATPKTLAIALTSEA